MPRVYRLVAIVAFLPNDRVGSKSFMKDFHANLYYHYTLFNLQYLKAE